MTGVEIRPASPADCERIWELVRELADYEKLEHLVIGSPEKLREHLFLSPVARSWVAECQSIVGYAICFSTFSTFRTQPGLWLEDLYVTPSYRGQGIGKRLLETVHLAASESGCGRLEWSVLDWNEPAIEFYKAFGARVHPEWWTCRIEF